MNCLEIRYDVTEVVCLFVFSEGSLLFQWEKFKLEEKNKKTLLHLFNKHLSSLYYTFSDMAGVLGSMKMKGI